MSDYTTVDLLIESIDEEAGGPLTSEGVELVRRGWISGQKATESQLTTAQAEIEALRGRVAELEKVIAKSKSALRKHRWCGDYYPENGWPEVNEALAYAQRLRAEADQREGGEGVKNLEDLTEDDWKAALHRSSAKVVHYRQENKEARQIITDLVEYAECNDPGNPHLGRAKGFLSGGES